MVFEKATTRYVSLMLTHQCNLNCTYCYEQFKSVEVMSSEQAKTYIKEAFTKTSLLPKYKALELSFMGGEPLLRFDVIKEVAEWTWRQQWPLPYIFFASTNGTLLTSVMKDWFQSHADRIVLGISLDGDFSMQEMNRGHLAAQIDSDFFCSTWPNQGIKATISKKTLPYLAHGIIHLQQQGFNTIYANLAYGVFWQEYDLQIYSEQLLLLKDFYVANPHLQRCSLLNLDLTELIDSSFSYSKHCGCGEGTLLIDVDGKEYPCAVFSPISLPKERIDALSSIDFSDIDSFVADECRKCLLYRACPKCYGMNFLHTGNLVTHNAFYCAAFKIQVLVNCILQEALLQHGLVENERMHEVYSVLKLLEKIL
ncbi:radical SAM protein [Bacteroides congonensis]